MVLFHMQKQINNTKLKMKFYDKNKKPEGEVFVLKNNVNRRVTRRWEGGALPCHFLKIQKSALIWRKKCPDCGHLLEKFVI